jgi:hypothetical protein
MKKMETANLNTDFDALLQEIAEKHEVDADLLEQLIVFERTKVHLEKRRGAKKQIRKMIEEAEEES